MRAQRIGIRRRIAPQPLHQLAAGERARPCFGQCQQDVVAGLVQLQRLPVTLHAVSAAVDMQAADA
ncbi:hypothetical protein D3C72_2458600 [compost metagenome]